MSAGQNSGGTPKRRGRPWPKGVSGNPGGRPSTPREVMDFIGGHTLEAAQRLVEIMRGKDPQQARLAAEALLDRRLGKPAVAMEVTAKTLTAVPAEFAGAAAGLLERALEEADEAERQSSSAVTDVEPSAENVKSVAGGVASPSENGTAGDLERALSARSADEGGQPE